MRDEPKPITIADIVERMNWLASQSEAVREALAIECDRFGHRPTGERVMTAIPKDSCWRCGRTYVQIK